MTLPQLEYLAAAENTARELTIENRELERENDQLTDALGKAEALRIEYERELNEIKSALEKIVKR